MLRAAGVPLGDAPRDYLLRRRRCQKRRFLSLKISGGEPGAARVAATPRLSLLRRRRCKRRRFLSLKISGGDRGAARVAAPPRRPALRSARRPALRSLNLTTVLLPAASAETERDVLSFLWRALRVSVH